MLGRIDMRMLLNIPVYAHGVCFHLSWSALTSLHHVLYHFHKVISHFFATFFLYSLYFNSLKWYFIIFNILLYLSLR